MLLHGHCQIFPILIIQLGLQNNLMETRLPELRPFIPSPLSSSWIQYRGASSFMYIPFDHSYTLKGHETYACAGLRCAQRFPVTYSLLCGPESSLQVKFTTSLVFTQCTRHLCDCSPLRWTLRRHFRSSPHVHLQTQARLPSRPCHGHRGRSL